jgi:hypothetical protein
LTEVVDLLLSGGESSHVGVFLNEFGLRRAVFVVAELLDSALGGELLLECGVAD